MEIDSKKFVVGVFTYMTNAFVSVSHPTLIEKLSSIGVQEVG